VLAAAQTRLDQNAAPDDSAPAQETDGLQGIVLEVSSSLCRVDVQGQDLLCGLRGSLSAQETGFTNVVAVGDHVIVSPDGAGRGVVEAILPRRSVLARPDVFASHLQQVIVANADQLLVVASWREPAVWLELIDRYLIAAERHNLLPVICVNKVDLAEDEAFCRAELRPYVDLGYRVLFTSALTGAGVDDLRDLLRDKTTVLAGLSGVGKSSLLAAVQPGLKLRTRNVSDSGEGRHTTTQVTLLKLDPGGFVVDQHPRVQGGQPGERAGALLSRNRRRGGRVPLWQLLAHRRAGLRRAGGGAARARLGSALSQLPENPCHPELMGKTAPYAI
jgi:ribosome biogenesis GTPase